MLCVTAPVYLTVCVYSSPVESDKTGVGLRHSTLALLQYTDMSSGMLPNFSSGIPYMLENLADDYAHLQIIIC